MAKQKGPPIGFGRTPLPKDDFDEEPDPPEDEPKKEELPPEPPLAMPVFVGEMERYELLARYDVRALLPISAFEMQLIQIIAGLEKRIREIDHD